jgi:hypothetical protein
MAFIIGLPVAQIILFCLSIGHDPKGLQLAVSNHELSDMFIDLQECPVTKGCNYTIVSCRYLEYLKNRSIVLVSSLNLLLSHKYLIEIPFFRNLRNRMRKRMNM